MPLSKRPRKSVCGLTRETVTTASASRAFLSQKTGSPQLLVPMRHGGHVGLDRHAEGLLADAVLGQQLALALGGGAAVAAHRGDDERLRAQVAQAVERGADDGGQVGDAAAADADGHPVAAAHAAGQREPLPLPADLAGDVGDDGLRGGLAERGDVRECPRRTTSAVSLP